MLSPQAGLASGTLVSFFCIDAGTSARLGYFRSVTSTTPVELRVHASMREFDRAEWESLLAPHAVPPMRWDFLEALESTGCVQPERGWLAQHLSFRREGRLVAVAPAYVKGNSEGEFVFDFAWARFCEQSLGRPYYPKLVVAVPFTPATGPRLLIPAGQDPARAHQVLAAGLAQLSEQSELSGVHVLFPPESGAAQLESAGYLRRVGVQYHWRNAGYGCFDDFLARFSSKRRNQIRRERRVLAESGVELRLVEGADLTSEALDHVYEFYRNTVDKHYYGRRYLNREFFHELQSRIPDNILVVFAYERGRRKPLAGAFNLISDRALFGRYWGASEERPFLHFNVCYYAGIEACIDRNLEYFEPGAGGEHKHARGFESTLTHSAHHLCDERLAAPVADFLRREREAVLAALAEEKPILRPLA